MKRITLPLACLLLLLVLPYSTAQAARPEFYVEARGLYSDMSLKDHEFKFDITIQNRTIDLSEKDFSGGGVAAIFGIKIPKLPLRAEVEYAFRTGRNIKSYRSIDYGLGGNTNVNTEIDISLNMSLLGNLWFDIPVGSFPVKPYLGVSLGFGVLAYESDLQMSGGGSPYISKDEYSATAALLAGVGGGAYIEISPAWSINLVARYMISGEYAVDYGYDFVESTFKIPVFDASVGLRYSF